MKQAILLSKQGMDQNKGGPFGAVVVKDGVIIGSGQNEVTSTNDPTAHAEVVAIRHACKATNSFSLTGTILYTSCEPCPMCLAAAYWARVDAIYFANTRLDAANISFDDSFIYEQMAKPVEKQALPMVQILRKEALEVFKAWMQKSDRTPY